MDECPSCDSPDLKPTWTDHIFPFRVIDGGNGAGKLDETVEVTAYIPVEFCDACGDYFVDWRGECIKEEAIKGILKLPTDREIEWALRQVGVWNMDVVTTGVRRDGFTVRVTR
tara:strand:- start:234 stop:572 length:339 start_codon:yes stop_codon:yes gene_type:complete